jgi:hypothetical protein
MVFRLTPAFAAGCGIAVGVLAAGGPPSGWLRAFALYGLGIVLAAGPVVAWLLANVSAETIWFETAVRPVAMTAEQSLPIPPLSAWPGWERKPISDWFVALQFRAWLLLYAGYAVGLAAAGLRAMRARKPFPHALLLAVAVWGGVYFMRALGRADSAHLYSAIPPVCLLVAHAASLGARSLELGRVAAGTAGALFLAAWIYLGGADRALDPSYRGDAPLEALGGKVSVRRTSPLRSIDRKIADILQRTRPGDRILDLSASPLLHVLSGRRGPGYMDLIMPGTFQSDEEELAFLARLSASPPALVIWPGRSFDDDPERAAMRSAPRVARWVLERYRPDGSGGRFTLLVPRSEPALPPSG